MELGDVNKANIVKANAKVKASHKIKSRSLHTVIIISVNSYYCQLHGKVYFKSTNCISERQVLPTVRLTF